MSLFDRFMRSLRDRGWRATLLSAHRRVVVALSRRVDRYFDRRFGTDTRTIVENRELRDVTSENLARGIRYEPTRARPFARLLRAARIPAQGTFVDIGCGRGRVLMLAALHGFPRVRGIEYSPSLCRSAEANLESLRVSAGLGFESAVHACDAAGYVFAPDDTVVFLFNPFDAVVLRRVLGNLRASLDEHPRPLCLIYHHPLWRKEIDACGLFDRAEQFWFGGCEFVVYRRQ